MQSSKLVLAFGALALGVASAAAHYRVTINSPSWIGSRELQPGDYKVDLEGNQAVIKTGKETIQVPAKSETSTDKFSATEIRTRNVNGKREIEEIRFGGTRTSILFPQGSAGAGGSD